MYLIFILKYLTQLRIMHTMEKNKPHQEIKYGYVIVQTLWCLHVSGNWTYRHIRKHNTLTTNIGSQGRERGGTQAGRGWHRRQGKWGNKRGFSWRTLTLAAERGRWLSGCLCALSSKYAQGIRFTRGGGAGGTHGGDRRSHKSGSGKPCRRYCGRPG